MAIGTAPDHFVQVLQFILQMIGTWEYEHILVPINKFQITNFLTQHFTQKLH